MANFRIRAAAKTAELFIYDEIGPEWLGMIGPTMVQNALKSAGAIDLIKVRINSDGGDAFDGNTIYNILKQHHARVEVDIDGVAASIASVIAMAGDEVRMAQNAMMMIHKPWSNMFRADAEKFRHRANVLDQLESGLIATYAKKTGLNPDDIADLLAAETWMTANQAVTQGFADHVTEDLAIAACGDITRHGYRNVPKDLADRMVAAAPRPIVSMNRRTLADMNACVQKLHAA